VIKHSANTINDWIITFYKQYKEQFTVAIDLSEWLIVYALQYIDFVTIHLVNSVILAQYQKAFSAY
jgi:hypothetical protein